MHRAFRSAALAIGALLVFAPSSSPRAQPPADAQTTHTHIIAPDTFTSETQASMDRMMAGMHAAPATGDADIDFLAMMIPHHEGAVEMARLLLLNGRDPLVRTLAEQIIAAQQSEIQAMKERLSRLRLGVSAGSEYPALTGTRGSVEH
jgi:uncharacterized protein (DUF305 family)